MKEGERLINKTEIHMKSNKPIVKHTFLYTISTSVFNKDPSMTVESVAA